MALISPLIFLPINIRNVEFWELAKVVVLDARLEIVNVGEVAHGQMVLALHGAEHIAHVIHDPLLLTVGQIEGFRPVSVTYTPS